MNQSNYRNTQGNKRLQRFLTVEEHKVNFVRFTNPADEYYQRDGIVQGVTKTGTRLKIAIASHLKKKQVTRHPRNVELTADFSQLTEAILEVQLAYIRRQPTPAAAQKIIDESSSNVE